MKNARQVVVVAKKETLTNFLSQSSKLETRGLATIIVALNQGGKNETLHLNLRDNASLRTLAPGSILFNKTEKSHQVELFNG